MALFREELRRLNVEFDFQVLLDNAMPDLETFKLDFRQDQKEKPMKTPKPMTSRVPKWLIVHLPFVLALGSTNGPLTLDEISDISTKPNWIVEAKKEIFDYAFDVCLCNARIKRVGFLIGIDQNASDTGMGYITRPDANKLIRGIQKIMKANASEQHGALAVRLFPEIMNQEVYKRMQDILCHSAWPHFFLVIRELCYQKHGQDMHSDISLYPAVEPVVEPAIKPTSKPAVTPVVESAVQPTSKPVVRRRITPAVKPAIKSAVQPVSPPKAQEIPTKRRLRPEEEDKQQIKRRQRVPAPTPFQPAVRRLQPKPSLLPQPQEQDSLDLPQRLQPTGRTIGPKTTTTSQPSTRNNTEKTQRELTENEKLVLKGILRKKRREVSQSTRREPDTAPT